jgi:hypothetical protein
VCTVSLVATLEGYRLASNRDERRTRPPALPPREHRLGDRRALFPTDPQGGGTWIGGNDAGLAATLLNHHPPAWRSAARALATRGRIVPELLAAGTFDAALSAIDRIDAARFAPFRLVVTDGARVAAVTSDGQTLSMHRPALDRPLMFTSSSLGDALVEGPRRALFDELMAGGRDRWREAQRTFHRHQWEARPELSVRMAREEAMTVSYSQVEVGSGLVQFAYESYQGDAVAGEQVMACGPR